MAEEQAKTKEGPATQEQQPIFKEIETMSPEQAVEVLIQAANLAQGAGRLTVRDSVMLAKAIDLIRPGSI